MKISTNRLLNKSGYQEACKEYRVHSAVGEHPNVASVYGGFTHLNRFYLVMELLPYGDLRSALSLSPQAITTKTSLDIALQLARGLSHLHSVGIAHCDLKLENVLLAGYFDAQGRNVVKLVDFGRSLAFNTGLFGNASDVVPPGTLDYMSLEALCGMEHDPRKSDVFSLGVVLFELLFGHRPFEINSEEKDSFWAHIQARRQWSGLSETDAHNDSDEVPQQLRLLLHSMLQRRWQLRPTMQIVVERLEFELTNM